MIEPEPRACSLLLLQRLDDREGQQMLRAYLVSEVVELGESIGVETRLYSEQAQRNRIRALELVCRSQAMASVRLDPLVPFDRPVEPLRLQVLLEICASFRRALVDAEAPCGPQTAGVLLCLPYLRVPQWHMRWRLLGRSFGWCPVPGIENRTYFKRAICAALRPLPANAPCGSKPISRTKHTMA